MRFATVFKNSFFYTFAAALQGMISFFLLPIYTKYLTPSDYAILALVTSFVGLVSSIITLQIHSGVTRFVIKFLKDEDRAKKYFSGIFILLFGILLLGCLVINIFGERIIKIVFSNRSDVSYSPFFQIATWTLLPTLLISCGMLLLQALERGNKFFLITLVQVVANVGFGLFFVVRLETGMIGVLWAQLISAICGFAFISWSIRDWFRWVLSKMPLEDIKVSLRYSLPIIPHILSIYIYMYSDRLILQHYVPLAQVGIYSIADTFAFILLIIVNATTTAYSPRFLKLAEEDRAKAQDETKKFIEIWWAGIMAIFMGYLLLSNYIVKLMTQPSFYPCVPLIPILIIAYIFRGLYCFAVNSIFFVEKTKFIPVITISAALVNVVLNLIFIPKFGIFAAAWTTVVAYFVTFLLAYYFSQKYFPIIYPWRSMLKVVSFLIPIYIAVRIFDRIALPDIWVKFSFNSVMFILFIVILAFFIYRDYSVKTIKVITNFCKTQFSL